MKRWELRLEAPQMHCDVERFSFEANWPCKLAFVRTNDPEHTILQVLVACYRDVTGVLPVVLHHDETVTVTVAHDGRGSLGITVELWSERQPLVKCREMLWPTAAIRT